MKLCERNYIANSPGGIWAEFKIAGMKYPEADFLVLYSPGLRTESLRDSNTGFTADEMLVSQLCGSPPNGRGPQRKTQAVASSAKETNQRMTHLPNR